MSKLAFVLALVMFGCSVKKKPDVVPQTAPSVEIEGIKLSEKKKFLIHPSTDKLKGNEENTVGYRIVDEKLMPLDSNEYEVTVEYNMPHHPNMGGPWFPTVRRLGGGHFEATYNISMGGDWLFIFTIKKNGTLVDTASFWVRDVPEGA